MQMSNVIQMFKVKDTSEQIINAEKEYILESMISEPIESEHSLYRFFAEYLESEAGEAEFGIMATLANSESYELMGRLVHDMFRKSTDSVRGEAALITLSEYGSDLD